MAPHNLEVVGSNPPPPLSLTNQFVRFFYCANAGLSKPADFDEEHFCTGFVLIKLGFYVRHGRSHPGFRAETLKRLQKIVGEADDFPLILHLLHAS